MRFWGYLNRKSVWQERALLFKIARNIVIDYQRQKQFNVSLEQQNEAQGFEPSQPEDLSSNVDLQLFLNKLEKLSQVEQELIRLRYLQGLSPREIARVLQRSVGVISVQLTRAKTKLRKIYEI